MYTYMQCYTRVKLKKNMLQINISENKVPIKLSSLVKKLCKSVNKKGNDRSR